MLTLEPAGLDFGPVPFGSRIHRSLEVTNHGNTKVSLALEASTDDAFESFEFHLMHGSDGNIGPDETAEIEVVFAPKILGPIQAIMHLPTSQPHQAPPRRRGRREQVRLSGQLRVRRWASIASPPEGSTSVVGTWPTQGKASLVPTDVPLRHPAAQAGEPRRSLR